MTTAAGFNKNDLLNVAPGTTFQPQNDLNRLEVIAANEGPGLDRRLRQELGRVEGAANRVGEDPAVAKATAQSNRNSDNDAAQFERATRGKGLTARQQKSANRRLGLSRSLNRASATGATRRGFTDRSKAATSVGSGFGDALFSQRTAGETSLAQAHVTAKASRDQARADRKSGTLSAIGTVAGAALAFFSSEKLKHDHGHEPELLDKLKKVRVNRWQYKGDKKTHVGPFSEEFNREFGIDTDRPDMINVIDALGVTLGAVKELNKKVESRAQ